jgi:ferritin-like metal-binding protein YciE
MAIKTQEELFVRLLSNVKQNTERSTKIYQEIAQLADDPDIKEALEARVFVSEKILATLDRCFKMIGASPVKTGEELQDAFVEGFRREVSEIQSPIAKKLFILAKVNQVVHFRIAEYVSLIAMADVSGHYGVGVLLESCLADKLAFAERTKRLIKNLVEVKVLERMAR